MDNKYKEIVRYMFVGGTTTFLNILVYILLLNIGMDYKISNLAAIVLCKIYGYFANKIVVYRSKCSGLKQLFQECVKYITARGATGILDYVGLIIAVNIFCFDKTLSKCILQIVVIILNYILGKYIVFRHGNRSGQI